MSEQTIATLREQIARLLSQVDTAEKPRPTEIIRAGERHPGAVWRPVKDWTVRTIDDDVTDPRCVFVTCPEHHRSGCALDFDAVSIADARRLAMALLAAADWADGLASDVVVRLDTERVSTNPPKETAR